MQRRMKDSAPVVVFLLLGLVVMFAWALYAGAQVERCFYLTHELILCGEGWGITGTPM